MTDHEHVEVTHSHEHQEVTYLTHVRLPYHHKYEDLKLDPSSHGVGLEAFITNATELDISEEEWKRVIISAALLINTGKNYTVGECLDTALVWERG
jgi:hypothetical protein